MPVTVVAAPALTTSVTHLAWIQTDAGIDAHDDILFANVERDGRIVNVGGSAVADLAVGSTVPAVSAAASRSSSRCGGAELERALVDGVDDL